MSLPGPTPADSAQADADQADAVTAVVADVMASQHLKAVIVRVTIDGADIITKAYGESMPGVPATTAMHFRNGAVAISYVSTLVLELVNEQRVSLDDKVSRWLPHVPHSDEVTLRQLAQMTSGIVDYVTAPELSEELYADPFRTFTPEQLIAIGTSRPLL